MRECRRQNGKLINSASILTEEGASRVVRVWRIALAKVVRIQVESALIPSREGVKQGNRWHFTCRYAESRIHRVESTVFFFFFFFYRRETFVDIDIVPSLANASTPADLRCVCKSYNAVRHNSTRPFKGIRVVRFRKTRFFCLRKLLRSRVFYACVLRFAKHSENRKGACVDCVTLHKSRDFMRPWLETRAL